MNGVPRDLVHSLRQEVENLARDISRGCGSSFDPSHPCAVCGGIGHTFASYPELQDNDQIKKAFIYLKITMNKVVGSVDWIRN